MRTLLSLLLSVCTFVAVSQDELKRYELVKMDNTINTFRHEAAPVITADGNTLYFFVDSHPDNTYGKDDTQDIWMSRKDANGVWSPAEHLRNPFNIHPYNQLFTAFDDGSAFVKGGRSKGEKGFSIISAGGSLQELDVKDFKSMNKGRFYGATMSADKRHMIIYFSEKANSIYGDLYVSHVQPDGSWSQPKMLEISAPQDDVGPFIDPDQKTLYFASARMAPGRQGQTDIYKCTRLDDSWENWSTPVNLGKPINTGGEDFYFTIDRAGNVITSRANKALEGAQLDLYMLVPKDIQINLVGLVYNQKNNNPLQATVEVKVKEKDPIKLESSAEGKFETRFPEVSEYMVTATAQGFLPSQQSFSVPLLYNDTTLTVDFPLVPEEKEIVLHGTVTDKKTGQPVTANITLAHKGTSNSASLSASGGKFQRSIEQLGWYLITANAEGYMNATDSININDEEVASYAAEIQLQPIEVGVTVRLKNIYFDFDRTTLQEASYPELNKVVEFLKQNPSVEIEIAGHTDDKGSDIYNQTLSQGRSQTVVDYIIGQGIESHRLTARGYGESKPIDTNDTPEGQANNRRVEFTVVKK